MQKKVELQQQWHEGMSPDVEYTLTISEPGEVDDYDYRYWLRGEGNDDLGITVSEDSDTKRHYDLGKHCRKYKQSPTTHIDRIIDMLSQGRQDMRYILHASDSEARTQDYYDREFAQFVLGRAVLASEAKVAKIVVPASMSEEALILSGKISAKPSVVGILFSSAVKRAQKPYNWRLTEHALAGAITKRAQSPSERSPYFADKPASKKA